MTATAKGTAGPEGAAAAPAAGEHAAVIEAGGLRLERRLPGPIERVWAYLVEPDKRGEWLARGDIEPRVGGSVALRFVHADLSAEKVPPERYRVHVENATVAGQVTRWEPPHVLGYTWREQGPGESEVTFELSPRGTEVLLVLTHRRLATRGDVVGVASGWHSHLGVLEDRLVGREPRGFWSAISALEGEYEARVPAG